MKQRFMKMVATIITVSSVLIGTVSCNAVGQTNLKKFSDVPEEYWGYQTIMDMTKVGLFKGTTEPINGVGTFSPEKVMTRAEFITAALRAVCPKEAQIVKNDGEIWWSGYYKLALNEGILEISELYNGDLEKPMTREEMAMVMVRCVEKKGEELTRRVATSQIADYSQIDDYYKEYVRNCFSFGLLCGVNSMGTFAPVKSLTRAEAATVLCRLLDKDKRVKVEFTEDTNSDDSYVIPWENGGKKPEEYTWEEFENLEAAAQMAFQNHFDSIEAFDAWLQKAQGSEADNSWDGEKNPEEYTWEEFENLDAAAQMAFQNHFDSIEAFDAWLQKAQGGEDDNPWENGGKKPKEYTWEEFEALDAAEQMAFQNSFDSIEAFDAWLQKAQGSESSSPWENGEKKPEEYTWEEFEALDATEQMKFQNSMDNFDEWFEANYPNE